MRDFLDVFIESMKFEIAFNWRNPKPHNTLKGYGVLWDDYTVTTAENPSVWAVQFLHDAILQRDDAMIDGVCLQSDNENDTVTISPVTWFKYEGDAKLWRDEMEYTKVYDIADERFID